MQIVMNHGIPRYYSFCLYITCKSICVFLTPIYNMFVLWIYYQISLGFNNSIPQMFEQHCQIAVHWLTHWGWVTHICVGKLMIIGSHDGLSPERRQAIICPSDGILLIGPNETTLNEILIEMLHCHARKCIWKCRLENGGHFVGASMWEMRTPFRGIGISWW